MERIYLDYNASTPIAPEVAQAMLPYLKEHYGNPSATHWASDPARAAVANARSQVAMLIGADADEMIFTSGGSESNNHALKGLLWRSQKTTPHIITSAIEHPAVIQPCRFLERQGARLTILPVDSTGMVDPDDVRKAIGPDTVLVSIMHANNEVGTIQAIREIAAIARDREVVTHTDAAQSVGKVPVAVSELGVDLLSIAGHKLYAPKGVGALYVRRGVQLEPLIHGAEHESGRRAGTENVLLIVGLGAAAQLAREFPCAERLKGLRDRLWENLRAGLADRVTLNGHVAQRLPNTLNVSVSGCSGPDLLHQVPVIAASTGSACHAGTREISPVLYAMGLAGEAALGALRLSVGRMTTEQEIDVAAQLIVQSVMSR